MSCNCNWLWMRWRVQVQLWAIMGSMSTETSSLLLYERSFLYRHVYLERMSGFTCCAVCAPFLGALV